MTPDPPSPVSVRSRLALRHDAFQIHFTALAKELDAPLLHVIGVEKSESARRGVGPSVTPSARQAADSEGPRPPSKGDRRRSRRAPSCGRRGRRTATCRYRRDKLARRRGRRSSQGGCRRSTARARAGGGRCSRFGRQGGNSPRVQSGREDGGLLSEGREQVPRRRGKKEGPQVRWARSRPGVQRGRLEDWLRGVEGTGILVEGHERPLARVLIALIRLVSLPGMVETPRL